MENIIRFLFVSLTVLSFTACETTTQRFKEVNLEDTPEVNITIHRYEQDLFNLPPDSLTQYIGQLQDKYTFFLGTGLIGPDQINRLEEYLTDPLLQEINHKRLEKESSFSQLNHEISTLYRYLKYHFPTIYTPEIYTYISGVDYMHPTQLYDSTLIIAIDMYLGSDFEAYQKVGLPKYKRDKLQPEYITVDIAKTYADKLISTSPQGDLINQMIAEGKKLYIQDILQPNKPDHLKIKYSPAQFRWCEKNESQLWEFIIENELLFSGNYSKFKKLLSEGPFTSEFGQQSAPRLGHYVGWQIVREYMNHLPTADIHQLIENKDAREILKKSKYKP